MNDFKTIKFSQNWNRKLDNIIFSTIRKENYYVELNDKVAIVLNDKLYKWCEVIAVATCKFIEIGPILLTLDTGYEYEAAIKIFDNMGIPRYPGDTLVKFYLLKSIENPKVSLPEKIVKAQDINLKLNL